MNKKLRDSTSEWDKQKEALKKISNAIGSKGQAEKEKNHQSEESSPPPSE